MENLKSFFLKNSTAKQTVFKNAFWLYFSEGLAKCLKLIIFILIIKFLGPKNFGILEYWLSFVGVFFLFADFGFSNIFIRDYQQQENKESHITTFFWLKFLFSFIFALLAIFGYFFSKKFSSFFIYFLFVIFYFLTSLGGFFESFFISLQKTEKKFLINVSMLGVLFIFILWGLLIRPGISVVILSYVISVLFSLVIGYFLFSKEAKIVFSLDPLLVKYYLFNGLPLVFFGLLSYIFFASDKILLAHLRPIEEVGYYSLASRVLGVLFIIPSLLNTALYPYLAKKVYEKHILLKSLFSTIVFGSIIAGFIFSVLAFFFAPILIPLFFGKGYLMSISVLQLFVWISVFVFPTIFLDYFLISNNKQWLDFWLTLVPAILNLALNFVLIPSYGVFGAVYSSIVSQIINFSLTLIASIFVLEKLNLKSL